MHRHKETRAHKVVHHFNFFLAGVARYMHAVALFVNNVRAQLVKVINRARNKFFVARNRRCGNNNRIARHNINFFVVVHRHTRQCGHRLALAAGGDDNNLARLVIAGFVNVNQHAFRHFQIAKLNGNINNIDHTASNNGNFTFVSYSAVNDLLNAVYVGRECCHDNTVFSIAELIVKGLPYHFFTGRITGALSIGAVCH